MLAQVVRDLSSFKQASGSKLVNAKNIVRRTVPQMRPDSTRFRISRSDIYQKGNPKTKIMIIFPCQNYASTK